MFLRVFSQLCSLLWAPMFFPPSSLPYCSVWPLHLPAALASLELVPCVPSDPETKVSIVLLRSPPHS